MSKLFRKIKTLGFCKTIKVIYDRLKAPFVPFLHAVRWGMSCLVRRRGITNKDYGRPLVVSLTTYPARMPKIHLVIESLLMQSLKPNRLILWLAPSQFPNKEEDLPQKLLKLRKKGFEILWCEDTRSYKKLIPTLELCPDAVIITADDDVYYNRHMVKKLYRAYQKAPDTIHCHRASKFYRKEDAWRLTPGGYDIHPTPTYLHKLTGVSGVLYGPGILHEDITNAELFRALAPTNDDLWFWLMGVLKGTKCNVVKHNCAALYFIKGTQATALCNINDTGEKLLWQQLQNIFDHYEGLEKCLLQEWNAIGERT